MYKEQAGKQRIMIVERNVKVHILKETIHITRRRKELKLTISLEDFETKFIHSFVSFFRMDLAHLQALRHKHFITFNSVLVSTRCNDPFG